MSTASQSKFRDSVISCLQDTVFEQQFIPLNEIDELVTLEQVHISLKDAGAPNPEVLKEFIFTKGAKRVFLVLTLMKSVALLDQLRHYGLDDNALPIHFHGPRGNDTYNRFPFLRSWDISLKNLFKDYQRMLTAPKFGNTTFRTNFDYDCVLPYLEQGSAAASGFFGEVSKTVIHKAHLTSSFWPKGLPGDRVAIAIKRVKDEASLIRFFDIEANNLQTLREFSSPHLIKPIAAYQHRENRCLMFPWASGGNLNDYWSRKDHTDVASGELHWLLAQFSGLSSALEELHNQKEREARNCIHGDLKPENILVFEEDNARTLQIADMGLAAFHTGVTDLRDPSNMPLGTSRYVPPEMTDQEDLRKSRSRRYDLWSMGCVVLELVIWLVSGYDALETFKGKTKRFWGDNNDPRSWIGKPVPMHLYVHAYLEVIEQKLHDARNNDSVVVRLLKTVRGLLLNKQERTFAEQLKGQFKQIQLRCETDTAFRTVLRIPYPEKEIQEVLTQGKHPDIVYDPNRPHRYEGTLQVPGQNLPIDVPESSVDEGISLIVPTENMSIGDQRGSRLPAVVSDEVSQGHPADSG